MIYKKISIVICTYNRADLLDKVLFSFLSQNLSIYNYEIIIVIDGSTDNTNLIINKYLKDLPIIYLNQQNLGLAYSKNVGFQNSSGDIVLFLDDDDILTPNFLEEHLKSHNQHPSPNIAILGYTDLHKSIKNDPLMHYVTCVEYFLYSYPSIKSNFEKLNFHYAWGGRTSFKKSLLLQESQLFNPKFKFGCEDIEMGFRFAKYSKLTVVFNKNAISFTIRKITFDDFCKRMHKQGESCYSFLLLHNCSEISNWVGELELRNYYNKVSSNFDTIIKASKKIDIVVRDKIKAKFDLPYDLQLLHKAYYLSFMSSKAMGFMVKS